MDILKFVSSLVCGVKGHDWTTVKVAHKKDDVYVLYKVCTRCGKTKTDIKFNKTVAFEDDLDVKLGLSYTSDSSKKNAKFKFGATPNVRILKNFDLSVSNSNDI